MTVSGYILTERRTPPISSWMCLHLSADVNIGLGGTSPVTNTVTIGSPRESPNSGQKKVNQKKQKPKLTSKQRNANVGLHKVTYRVYFLF